MMLSNSNTSKSNFRAKAKGLRINTNIPLDLPLSESQANLVPTPANVAPKSETFSQLATAPARKLAFNVEDDKPKASKAMMSTDWRKNYRPQDPLPTAPPKKVQFSDDEVKPKKPQVDTASTNCYGVRRYRDSPVDPDFIRSAPATKLEFGVICEDDDDVDYHINRGQDQSLEDSRNNNLVQLESFDLMSNVHDIPKSLANAASNKRDGSSSLMLVSPVTPSQNQSHIRFPLAEIQAVKNGKRFHTRDWNDVDDALKHDLTDLRRPPLTAGLPPDQLRQEFERLCKKAEAEKERQKETERFNALVKKLQQLKVGGDDSARRPSIIDIKPPYWTKDQDKENEGNSAVNQVETKQLRSPRGSATSDPSTDRGSCDSGISGISIDDNKKANSLNPQAANFAIPFGSTDKTKRMVTEDELQVLWDRVAKLEAEAVARDKLISAGERASIHQPFPRVEEHFPARDMAPETEGFYPEQFHSNGNMPNIQPPFIQQPSVPQFAPQQQSYTSALQQTPYTQTSQFQGGQIEAMAMPQMSTPPVFQAQQDVPMMQDPMVAQGMLAPICPQPVPQASPVYIHSQLAGNLPSQGPTQMWPNQAPLGGFTGPQRSNPAQTVPPGHPFAFAPIGPKPVAKPKGPPRAGNTQQLQYEAYLEWKRSTDPKYAQECRARQAKRAARQRASKA